MKQIKRIGSIYISLIVLFVLTMTISYMIPNKKIEGHVRESLEQLNSEGVYPKVGFNTHAAQLDNFTDSWMLDIALSSDNKHPLKSSLENPYRVASEFRAGKITQVENLNKVVNEKNYEKNTYSRYWHGYLVILRPLLLFLNYTELRFINICCLFLLFIIANNLIKKKLGIKIMLSFFISIMMSMFIIIPMSLQFSSIFYIVFISTIVMLIYDEIIKEKNLGIYIFFIIGSITSFLDLLTVPVVTLGIPLVIYILMIQKKQMSSNSIKLDDIQIKTGIDNIIEIIKNSIIWGIGYGTTWASKWIIATIVLKENIITNALNQISSRTSDTSGELIITTKNVIDANKELMYTDFIIKMAIILFIAWIICLVLYRKKSAEIINIAPILIIALMPYVWYMVLKNHSYIHFWFTYRNLSITTFAILAFMSYVLDTKKIAQQIGGHNCHI